VHACRILATRKAGRCACDDGMQVEKPCAAGTSTITCGHKSRGYKRADAVFGGSIMGASGSLPKPWKEPNSV